MGGPDFLSRRYLGHGGTSIIFFTEKFGPRGLPFLGDNPSPKSFLGLVEVIGGRKFGGGKVAAAAHRITQRETVNRGMNAVPSIRELFQLQSVSQIVRIQLSIMG